MKIKIEDLKDIIWRASLDESGFLDIDLVFEFLCRLCVLDPEKIELPKGETDGAG